MNNRILRIFAIAFALSAVNLMAEETNYIYNSVQDLPTQYDQGSGNIWDFRNAIITGDTRIRIRNFGDSILDRTNIFERNDYFQRDDSIFISGFENYKFNLACDTPQYILKKSEFPHNTQAASFSLDGKAYLQYPVHLSGKMTNDKPVYGTVLMPNGDSIKNVCLHHETYTAIILSKDLVTVTDSIIRNNFNWYIPDSKLPLASSSHTDVYILTDSIPYKQYSQCIIDLDYQADISQKTPEIQQYRQQARDDKTTDKIIYEPYISINKGILAIGGIKDSINYKFYISDVGGRIILDDVSPGYDISQLLPGQYIAWLYCEKILISKNFTVK